MIPTARICLTSRLDGAPGGLGWWPNAATRLLDYTAQGKPSMASRTGDFTLNAGEAERSTPVGAAKIGPEGGADGIELKYTQRTGRIPRPGVLWLAANVPDGITARPRSFEESRRFILLRRELAAGLAPKADCILASSYNMAAVASNWIKSSCWRRRLQRLSLGLPPILRQRRQDGRASIRDLGHHGAEAGASCHPSTAARSGVGSC